MHSPVLLAPPKPPCHLQPLRPIASLLYPYTPMCPLGTWLVGGPHHSQITFQYYTKTNLHVFRYASQPITLHHFNSLIRIKYWFFSNYPVNKKVLLRNRKGPRSKYSLCCPGRGDEYLSPVQTGGGGGGNPVLCWLRGTPVLRYPSYAWDWGTTPG